MNSKEKLSVHIFFSSIENESRLMKETASLIRMGLVNKIIIIGKGDARLLKLQHIDKNRSIIRIPLINTYSSNNFFLRKIIALIRLLQYIFSTLRIVMDLRPSFISCHNILLLPLGAIIKWKLGSKLIYMPHELETERTGLKGINKKLSKISEKFFIVYVDKTVVVSQPILDWYQEKYDLKQIYLLPNIPYNPYVNIPLVKKNHFRQEFNIPDDHFIFIYQGIIDVVRGCGDLIEIFKSVNPDRHLIMMGFGNMLTILKEVAAVMPNIHFKDSVSMDEIIDYTSSADIGIFYLPFEISLSYRYSLPNKFHEYLMGGLPVIVSDNLEYLSKLISNNELGWVLSDNRSEFISLINSMDRTMISSQKINSYIAKEGWQFHEHILREVYI